MDGTTNSLAAFNQTSLIVALIVLLQLPLIHALPSPLKPFLSFSVTIYFFFFFYSLLLVPHVQYINNPFIHFTIDNFLFLCLLPKIFKTLLKLGKALQSHFKLCSWCFSLGVEYKICRSPELCIVKLIVLFFWSIQLRLIKFELLFLCFNNLSLETGDLINQTAK